MQNLVLPWQTNLWRSFAEQGAKLPHAMLFSGQSGIGKAMFARAFAQSLVCEQRTPMKMPCYQCLACQWVAQGNHPDLRLVRPEVLELAEGAVSSESSTDVQADDEAIIGDGKRTKRQPSKDIRIEQIRQLADFLSIASHRGGPRAVVLYPASAMNVYTANALLKMLEEPPQNTYFLLVADVLELILPTIRSRCRIVQMYPPAYEESRRWLAQQGVAESGAVLAEYGGAPLSALSGFQNDLELATHRSYFLRELARVGELDVLAVAENMSKCELPTVVGWLQRWLYDCLSYRLARRIRYYPSEQERIAHLAKSINVRSCLNFCKALAAERRVVDHPLNARLFLENILLGYVESIDVLANSQ